MNNAGKHILADIYLNEIILEKDLIKLCLNAIKESSMTVLKTAKHNFGGNAFTFMALLAESHFSVHTFPESNYISIDCYTCGNEGNPIDAINYITAKLDIKSFSIKMIERGGSNGG